MQPLPSVTKVRVRNARWLATVAGSGTAVLWYLFLVGTAQGADPIAKYLEPSTVCVVRVDLKQLDLPSYTKVISEEFPNLIPEQAIGGVQAAAGAALQGLREAGAKEVYVTLSTIELTNGQASLIIPCDNVDKMSAQLEKLIGILPPAFGYAVHHGSGAVIACTEEVWLRLQATTEADSDNLLRAVEDQVAMDLSISVAIHDSLRETVADIWPDRLPSVIPLELSPKQLMSDVLAVHMGAVALPQLRLAAGINCVDAAAARRTLQTLKELMSAIEVNLPIAQSGDRRLVMELDGQQIGKLIGPFLRNIQDRTASSQQSNNLKQLGLAMHEFQRTHGGFPPRMTVNPQEQPLLSWRVHLLPFLGEGALYDDFHLDEPWFSQHNKRLVERMPQVYQFLSQPGLEPGLTCMHAPRMAGSFWDGNEDRLLTFEDLPDGTSNTLCVVIAPREKAVIWTQPEDLQIDPNNVKESLFGDRESMQGVFFDASVQMFGNNFPAETYRAWLTHAGGEKVERP